MKEKGKKKGFLEPPESGCEKNASRATLSAHLLLVLVTTPNRGRTSVPFVLKYSVSESKTQGSNVQFY